MKRVDLERNYWDVAAQDPEVDTKFICDVPTEDCIGELIQTFPPIMTGKRVAEIGCGVGRLIIPLANTYPDTEFFGTDISTY